MTITITHDVKYNVNGHIRGFLHILAVLNRHIAGKLTHNNFGKFIPVGGFMKEFCFGLAIGTLMGVLIVSSSEKLGKALQKAEKETEKKVTEIKDKLSKKDKE